MIKVSIMDYDILTAKTGTTEGLLNIGKAHYAVANLAECKFGNEEVGGSASLLSANAHVQYGLTNSAGINASLVRAEGYAGPLTVGTGVNLDCGAAIGVNGIEMTVLGTGFSIGPKLALRTPFADVSLKLF